MRSLLPLAALSLSLSVSIAAQGEFVNFEIQPVHALEVITLDAHDYLLVCNTPDNSVEIYDVRTDRFLLRVPVGLAPVSVRWHAAFNSFYTCNFLGDSVSFVRLVAPSKQRPLRAIPERTSYVGDEPTDLEFWTDDLSFLVTLNSQSAFGWYNAISLLPLGGSFGQKIPLTFPVATPTATKALTNPRRIAIHNGKLLVLGGRGGNNPSVYDFDLFGFDLLTGLQTDLGGLGSNNFNLRSGVDGKLYVAGQIAQNSLVGEAQVSQASTGFVESHMWIVDNAGTQTASVTNRDLNRNRLGSIEPKTRAISQPTDIELLEHGTTVTKVFLAGFGSDRIRVLVPSAGAPSTWVSRSIDLPNQSTAGYTRTGPRALAMRRARPLVNDPGAKLYCLNSLNHTISVIDPNSETELRRIDLQGDPTPVHIREGREFLYSADHSGTGFVACSSCHIDARTDGLTWNLGTPGGGQGPVIPQHLIDGVTGSGPTDKFPTDKGPMVTQTLQGLVNYPVEGSAQYMFTNAPYHWRGDKNVFTAFNSAFVSLMGSANVGTPTDPLGVTPSQMLAYQGFVESIVYPPNPEQPLTRTFSGTLGNPDLEDGTGGLRGLKLFHTHQFLDGVIAGRSCVQCHSLPDGSNNRITLTTGAGGTGAQPIETAAMRGLIDREGKMDTETLSLSSTLTGEFGLLNTGLQISMNSFVFNTFNAAFGDVQKTFDVIAFVREMDWGVAPLIGRPWTVDLSNSGSSQTATALDLAEGQVRAANIGIAVYVRSQGRERGFYYDASSSPQLYREEGTATGITRAQLLALITTAPDRIIFQATPVGSERRIASTTGKASTTSGPKPSQVSLQPMAASSAWSDVPKLTKNWKKGTGTNDFRWLGTTPEPVSLKTQRIYQQALISKAPAFGLTSESHQAPRRFAVAGKNIRPGAKLILLIPASKTSAPPYSNGEPVQVLTMPIFPTAQSSAGLPIWETTVEAAPLVTEVLLLGGPFAPDVTDAYYGNVAEPPPSSKFAPLTWNWYHVSVLNEDGTGVNAGWQRLTIR